MRTIESQQLKRILLEVLYKSAVTIESLFQIFTAPYGSSVSGIQYHVSGKSSFIDSLLQDLVQVEKQRFHVILHRLQKQGIIEKKQKGNMVSLFLTKRGEKMLKKIKSSLPLKSYEKKIEPTLKIVTFDIPEKERRKRDWLRTVLQNLGFSMLQKSVWTGKTKLPQELLEDLDSYHMTDYVEIFAVTKTGTLRKLV